MKGVLRLYLLVLLLSGALAAQTVKTSLKYSVRLPSVKTGKIPVLIFLHGYGSNEADLFELSKTMDPRFITFSLQAPVRLSEEGYCWYAMDFLPDQKFKYDYEQVKDSRQKILSFISNACKAYKLDSTQVFLLGFSQGAIMSYEIAFFAPSKIKGVMALSGRVLEETKLLKTDLPKLTKVSFFIAHGNSDNIIKIEESQKANALLKEKQVADVIYKNYEMPHSISGAELNDVRAWIGKVLPAKEKKSASKK